MHGAFLLSLNDTEAVCLSGDELAGAVGGWVDVGGIAWPWC